MVGLARANLKREEYLIVIFFLNTGIIRLCGKYFWENIKFVLSLFIAILINCSYKYVANLNRWLVIFGHRGSSDRFYFDFRLTKYPLVWAPPERAKMLFGLVACRAPSCVNKVPPRKYSSYIHASPSMVKFPNYLGLKSKISGQINQLLSPQKSTNTSVGPKKTLSNIQIVQESNSSTR